MPAFCLFASIGVHSRLLSLSVFEPRMDANKRQVHTRFSPFLRLFVFVRGAQHEALPLELGALEIQDHSNRSVADAEVIEHLPSLMIGDAINHFHIHNDLFVRNEVGHVLTDFHGPCI
jgi:hypothetical protein